MQRKGEESATVLLWKGFSPDVALPFTDVNSKMLKQCVMSPKEEGDLLQ